MQTNKPDHIARQARSQSDKPRVVILYESVIGSLVSDLATFFTAGLILLAEGKSFVWQVITVGMFVFWIAAKAGLGKVLRFYSKRDLVKWANSLPDDDNNGEAA